MHRHLVRRKPPVGTALVAEADTTGETLQLFGLNSLDPDASLDLAHGAGTFRPALSISQLTPRYPLFDQVIARDDVPFKQLVRHRTPFATSDEPGTVVTHEIVDLASAVLDGAGLTIAGTSLFSYLDPIVVSP